MSGSSLKRRSLTYTLLRALKTQQTSSQRTLHGLSFLNLEPSSDLSFSRPRSLVSNLSRLVTITRTGRTNQPPYQTRVYGTKWTRSEDAQHHWVALSMGVCWTSIHVQSTHSRIVLLILSIRLRYLLSRRDIISEILRGWDSYLPLSPIMEIKLI